MASVPSENYGHLKLLRTRKRLMSIHFPAGAEISVNLKILINPSSINLAAEISMKVCLTRRKRRLAFQVSHKNKAKVKAKRLATCSLFQELFSVMVFMYSLRFLRVSTRRKVIPSWAGKEPSLEHRPLFNKTHWCQSTTVHSGLLKARPRLSGAGQCSSCYPGGHRPAFHLLRLL